MASLLKCLPGCSLIDPVISYEFPHVIFVDRMGLLRFSFLLQAATEDLVEERSFTLQISDVIFLIGLRGGSFGEGQLPIDGFPEDLSDSLASAIHNYCIFLPGQQVMLSDSFYAALQLKLQG